MNRNQSFEFMRIILMLIIIAHHLGIHGRLVDSDNMVIRIFGMVVAFGCQAAVITFFMQRVDDVFAMEENINV